MVTLTTLHWIFLFYVLVVIVVMGLRRDPLIPCILGILHIGWMYTGGLGGAIQAVFNALVVAGIEFLGIIVVISLIVAMSKVLTELGADYLIMRPAAKLMVNADVAFWILGFAMLIVSWFVWPSPAVALIGGIMLPIAVRAGLPAMGAAMAMNIFGHGIALSSDYVIQGAPTITAKAAGLTSGDVVSASIPLVVVMGLVTSIIAFILVRRDIATNRAAHDKERQQYENKNQKLEITTLSYVFAFLVPLGFAADVWAMLTYDLKGGDATALVGGTAALLLAFGSVLKYGVESLEKITDFVRDGFMFGIKIFAPVIIIGGFFFLGKGELSQQILGKGAPGFLEDVGLALSNTVPLNKAAVAVIELAAGMIVGLDGSGFSPLPLVGSIAATFGTALPDLKVATLAALGQIAGVWTGGGTIIPWGLIPVAAIAGVNPIELARRNFIPVISGLAVTTIVAILLM
ncbi:conserved hypothetical protein [Heliomicrobium modesticaldum Ice1]|uniref:Transporter n=1 Tax=Heliobacterium modesticaldum (strain ATCC 51547 / Ice1) TaxID=498761 RepID=B0TBZ6_HELMI|nr:hypothetical protein [Heliomicrobium modesticaldum]ABZ85269.1 conserved hypothetical protein [Heliomicrobium modesticaldum Ice1]